MSIELSVENISDSIVRLEDQKKQETSDQEFDEWLKTASIHDVIKMIAVIEQDVKQKGQMDGAQKVGIYPSKGKKVTRGNLTFTTMPRATALLEGHWLADEDTGKRYTIKDGHFIEVEARRNGQIVRRLFPAPSSSSVISQLMRY